jgi:hypothetical protein
MVPEPAALSGMVNLLNRLAAEVSASELQSRQSSHTFLRPRLKAACRPVTDTRRYKCGQKYLFLPQNRAQSGPQYKKIHL